MIPLNPHRPDDQVLFMDISFSESANVMVYDVVKDMDEDNKVTLEWYNATVIARAGTVKAWMENAMEGRRMV